MNTHKFIIIGGGPGGLQLAYNLQQAGADYLILERADIPGSTFATLPRHRTLISINKYNTGCDNPEFNMRHDWNSLLCDDPDLRFPNYDREFFPNADNLVNYLRDFTERFALNIEYNTPVARIERDADGYQIEDTAGRVWNCEVLIIATGLAKPNVPMIEGIEHAEQYTEMSLDREEFTNKRVLIIGKKNSAFETADHLVPAAAMIHLVSPNSIRMAWKTHYVGDLRAVNNNILDTYQLKSQNAILDAEVAYIRPHGQQLKVAFNYSHANGEVEEIVYDRVLCCAGFKIETSMFGASATPQLAYNNKFPALTSGFESVNNPGMYFAGTLTHSLDFRKATSGFIHGFRYNARALATLLANRYMAVDLPSDSLALDAHTVTQRMLDRVNHSGGLWQQPGFIADVAVRGDDGLTYIKELPRDYIVENFHGAIYVLTLEYGAPIVGDPFAVERIHREDTGHSQESQFLHPIVRHYVDGELISSHEIIEDLEAHWVEPEHYKPLLAYFETQFAEPNDEDLSLDAALKRSA